MTLEYDGLTIIQSDKNVITVMRNNSPSVFIYCSKRLSETNLLQNVIDTLEVIEHAETNACLRDGASRFADQHDSTPREKMSIYLRGA